MIATAARVPPRVPGVTRLVARRYARGGLRASLKNGRSLSLTRSFNLHQPRGRSPTTWLMWPALGEHRDAGIRRAAQCRAAGCGHVGRIGGRAGRGGQPVAGLVVCTRR